MRDPEMKDAQDRILNFFNKEYKLVFDSMDINLDFKQYRYFIGPSMFFEVSSDYYHLYNIAKGTRTKNKFNYFDSYGYLLGSNINELFEDEWLLSNVK